MRSKSVSPEKRSRSRSVRRARDAGEKAGGSFTVPVSHTIVLEVFMKSIALAVLLLSASTLHAQMLADPSGHWKGTIEIPNASAVEFSVDFIRNIEGNIVGTVTTGADAATLPLLSVTVKDRTVTFYARTDQPFQGQLSATATLSGYALPFGMMRTGDAHIDPETKSPAVTKQLEGVWNGVLAAGGMAYHLILTITNQPDNTALAYSVSVDEGGLKVPVVITQNGPIVRFTARGVTSSYAGTMNVGGTE